MNDWLQSLAVGLAVVIGLVTPPAQLRLESQALRVAGSVGIQAEVVGAMTPQVRDYVLAGNSVTLNWQARWGELQREDSRTLTYHAWEDRFEISKSGAPPIFCDDLETAVAKWASLEQVNLGEESGLNSNLGTALFVTVQLAPPTGSLWGYRTLENRLLYRSWLEVPR